MEILGFTLTIWSCLTTWLVVITTYILYDWLAVIAWRRKYNAKGPLPLPVIGTLYKRFLKKYKLGDFERERLEEYGPVCAAHFGAIKCLHISDIELLKKIFVKDHLKFQNRYNIDGLEPSPLDSMLLILRDEEWKRVRNIVSPTFSPSKIKLMASEINFCADLLVKSLLEKTVSDGPVDVGHHFGCFTMDSVSGTTFGIRPQTYANPDQPFVQHARKVFGEGNFSNPWLLLAFIFPSFCKFTTKFWGASFFYPLESIKFFSDVIENVIEDRQRSNKTDRADMVGLLMSAEECKDGENKKLSRAELVAMGFVAFVAGYHTTGTLLTFLSYILATHPEVQDRLAAEIDAKYTRDDVNVAYDDIPDLPYLDQVISETLRMYPPILLMNRTTSYDEDIQLDGHWFPSNTMIQYSIWQVHRDLGLYDEPNKFKPERFSPEEKQKRDPFTFMPFGHGPRNCIGMRLALLEAKIAVIHVMKKLQFGRCAETEEPPELATEPFLRPVRHIQLCVKARK